MRRRRSRQSYVSYRPQPDELEAPPLPLARGSGKCTKGISTRLTGTDRPGSSRAGRHHHEMFRMCPLTSERTIRIAGEGGWRSCNHATVQPKLTRTALAKIPNSHCISIYYVHKVDVQRRDSTYAPSPQTYATAAFGEGRVRQGLRCQATAVSRVSEPAVSRAVAEREDIIFR